MLTVMLKYMSLRTNVNDLFIVILNSLSTNEDDILNFTNIFLSVLLFVRVFE